MKLQASGQALVKSFRLATLLVGCLFGLLFSNALYASGSFASGSSNVLLGNDLYNDGKRVVYRKVVCKKCPYDKSLLSFDNAKELISKIDTDAQLAESLSVSDRKAAIHYVKTRFRL